MRVGLLLFLWVGLILNSAGQVFFNEYVSSNFSGITDEDGDFPDWFELYNNSDVTVNLKNYTVTDDISMPTKWLFPTVLMPPYSYFLVFASGKNKRLASNNLHTNFKLGSEGEGLYLFNASQVFIDSINPVALPANVSYGRNPAGSDQWYYYENPTPTTENITPGVTNIITDTVFFSVQGGKHLGGLSLILSSNNPIDSIYYTTDGSIPDLTEDLYTSPISIVSNRVVRARIIRSNSISGPVFTNTYAVQYDHEFPIVCLSTEPDNLWDDDIGIYILGPTYDQAMPHYGANYWEEWEKPTHIELYDKAGVKQIDQVGGMKIFGGWSRMNDQKSVALFARKDYGKGSFEYKLFDSKPIDKFEAFVLRNSGNDYAGLRFQDEFLTSLTDEMDIDKQAFQPAAIYLNGTYWGILNIREKVNENFIVENHQVNKDEINLLEYDGSVIYGNNERYQSIIYLLGTHPALTDNSLYNQIADQIDIDNYIQYQLSQIYIDNGDWPGNNIKFWNTNSPYSKWRWILFDTDFGFGANGSVSYNTLDFALEANCNCGWPNPAWSTLLFRRMVSNIDFRNNFINQYADRINIDFKIGVIASKLDSFENLYNTEIQFHCGRWGSDYNYWLDLINNRKNFGIYRPYYARNHIQEVFNLSGQLDINVNVSSSSAGKVKVNSVIPKNYPFSGVYFKKVPIKLTAVPNPGYKFIRWEGTINSSDLTIDYNMDNAGTFKAFFEEALPEDISVVINEINYNSSVENNPKDWIEIYNNGSATVELTDWLISDTGYDTGYVFPAGTILSPDNYFVVYTDKEKFKTIFPNISNINGTLPFGLGGKGDQIFLYDNDRNLIDFVEYEDSSPWDAGADGTGATLELINPSYDNSLASSWKAGISGGTPGALNKWSLTTDNKETSIAQNSYNLTSFPNPFSDYTTISFELTEESFVSIDVFDINGSLIIQLVAERLLPGTYYYDWTGNGTDNSNIPGGVYTIRMSNNSEIKNLKIIKL